MTLKDKKNKREYNRKLKAEGGSNSSASGGNSKEKEAKKKDTKEKEKPSTNFTGVTESADKLITDANKRFVEATSQVGKLE